MARRVRIVTDSTSDLPAELAKAWGVTVVPLSVHFGSQTYRDGVDITYDEFYGRLRREQELPRTSQPPPPLFEAAFRSLLDDDCDVVAILISATLSGTYNVAQLVARTLAPDRIRVLDSGLVTLGTMVVVRATALRARESADLDDVARYASDVARRATFFAMVDTLDYLQRGGRIGRLSAFVGGLLSVKPLITMRDGQLVPLERARTRARGLARLSHLVVEQQPFDGPLVVGHSDNPELAAELRRGVRAAVPDVEIVDAELGPTVGTYAGPNAVGAALLRRA